MFSLYLGPKSFFYFMWLELFWNEQTFKCIQSSLNAFRQWHTVLFKAGQVIQSLIDLYSKGYLYQAYYNLTKYILTFNFV